jgi:hypothetical protein
MPASELFAGRIDEAGLPLDVLACNGSLLRLSIQNNPVTDNQALPGLFRKSCQLVRARRVCRTALTMICQIILKAIG